LYNETIGGSCKEEVQPGRSRQDSHQNLLKIQTDFGFPFQDQFIKVSSKFSFLSIPVSSLFPLLFIAQPVQGLLLAIPSVEGVEGVIGYS
jgi:hypothetical protein